MKTSFVRIRSAALFMKNLPCLRVALPLALLIALMTSVGQSNPLAPGRFGQALDANQSTLAVREHAAYGEPPLTVECWVRLRGKAAARNIIAANESSDSGGHWSLYSEVTTGVLAVSLPGYAPNVIESDRDITDDRWHHVVFQFEPQRARLFIDGVQVADRAIAPLGKPARTAGPLTIGYVRHAASLPIGDCGYNAGLPMGDYGYHAGAHTCLGLIDELRISRGIRTVSADRGQAPVADQETLGLWRMDALNADGAVDDAASLNQPAVAVVKKISMDEIDRESFKPGPAPMDSPAIKVTLQKGEAERVAGVPVVSLDGTWQMADGGEEADRLSGDWQDAIPAEVPGSVHTALQKAGKIPDPNVGKNDLIARESSFRHWWFKRSFPRPVGSREEKLIFDGVATRATVWLNGKLLGKHEGMFGGPEFDIGALLQDQNTLIVKLDPAPGDGRVWNVWHWRTTVVFNNTFGWLYGSIPPLGIWRSVRVEGAPAVRMTPPVVATHDLEKGTVGLATELQGLAAGWSGRLVGTIRPENFSGQSHHFVLPIASEGTEPKPVHLRFDIPSPRLWWPNGLGEQNLYRLELAFEPKSGVSDVKQTTFGLRTIAMAPLPGGPRSDRYDWTFVINGRPTFIKGTGWCTMDYAMDFSRARYDRLLTLAKLQHVQMLRAWGGGMPETDEFYDLCNRKGILVMQEWPTAWNSHSVQPYPVLEETVRRNTLRLRNHPSLAMYGGGNESPMPFGEAIDMMGRFAVELDGTRPFHRSDPWGGSLHSYACIFQPRPFDYNMNMTSAFLGEFGIHSLPVLESIARYVPQEEMAVWPPSPGGSLIHHTPFHFPPDRLAAEPRKQDGSESPHWNFLLRFSGLMAQPDSLKSMVLGSQVAQVTAVRHTLERARTRWPDCTGALYYKLNDAWPQATWSTVDYYGAPKIGHYFFRQAFAPLHACMLFTTVNLAGESAVAPDLIPGRFGKAINLANNSQLISIPGNLKERPVTFACWVKLNTLAGFNSILSVAPKTGKHWSIYTVPNSGMVSVFMPSVGDFQSSTPLQAGQWHYLAFRLERKSFELYVDGQKALAQTSPTELAFDEHPLRLGRIDGSVGCDGAVDELSISRGTDSLAGVVPNAPATKTAESLAVFHFDNDDEVYIEQPASSFPVFLLDDADALKDGGAWEVVARAYDSQLAEIKRESYKGVGAISRVAKLGEFTLTKEQARSTPLLFVVEVREHGALADRTFYWMNFETVQGCLFRLPRTELAMQAKKGTLVVTNQGKLPAVAVNVNLPGHADTFLASDNFFWLDPGESRTVEVNNTGGATVEAWNAEAVSIKSATK